MDIWEIIPERLYQANLPGMLGARADLKICCTELTSLDAIIRGEICMTYPFDDSPVLPDMAKLDALAVAVVEAVQRGWRVIIACNAGQNRSGLVLGLALLLLGYSDVVAMIQKIHPEALNNVVFAAYLRDKEKHRGPV